MRFGLHRHLPRAKTNQAIRTPAADPYPPEPLMASTFLGAPTLVVLWSFIGLTAVLLVVIHAFDPEKGQFGFPESEASNMVRIACGLGLWAAYSIRFACTGVVQRTLPRTSLVAVLIPVLVLSGPVGWIALLIVARVLLSRMRQGKLRTGLFVVLAAPCAAVTVLIMELAGWLLWLFLMVPLMALLG